MHRLLSETGAGAAGMQSPRSRRVDWMALVPDSTQMVRRRGDVVAAEGSKQQSMYVIVEGCVEMQRSGKVLQSLKEPELFGEEWLLDMPMISTFTVSSDTCILLCLNLERAKQQILNYKDQQLSLYLSEDSPRVLGSTPPDGPPPMKIQEMHSSPGVRRRESGRSSVCSRVTRTLSGFSSKGALMQLSEKLAYRLQNLVQTLTLPPTESMRETPLALDSAAPRKKDLRGTRKDIKKSKEHAKFIKRFKLPPSEDIVKDYAASMSHQGERSTLNGRLYVSENFLCYYSKGFAFRSKLVFPLAEVTRAVLRGSVLALTSKADDETKIDPVVLFDLKGEALASELLSVLNSRKSNTELTKSRPVSLERKADWVMEHQFDEEATKCLLLSDCMILLQYSVYHLYKRGDIVLTAKADNSSLYKVVSGSVRVETEDGDCLAVLGKNSYFGELSFLLSGSRTVAKVVANSDTVEVYTLDRKNLQDVLDNCPFFASRFYFYMATIIASRCIRHQMVFCSALSGQIIISGQYPVAITGTDAAVSFRKCNVQVTKQSIVFASLRENKSSPSSTVRVMLGDIQELQVLTGSRGISADLRVMENPIACSGNFLLRLHCVDTTVTIDFDEEGTAGPQWFLALVMSCQLFFNLSIFKNTLCLDTVVRTLYSGCGSNHIRVTDSSGALIEEWIHEAARHCVISMDIKRSVELGWDGVEFVGRERKDGRLADLPFRGSWDGLQYVWTVKQSGAAATQDTYIWYNTVLSFKPEVGNKSYEVQYTHMKVDGAVTKFVKMKDTCADSTGDRTIVAPISTPFPLVLSILLSYSQL